MAGSESMNQIKVTTRLALWGWLLTFLFSCNSLLDWDDTRPCGNGITSSTEECDDGNTSDGDGCSSTCLVEYTPSKKVDLLFVVDFSLSMDSFRGDFYGRFPELLSWLSIVKGGLPDLHIGITSMDVGASGNNLVGCIGEGDDGKLLKVDTPNLLNQNYIVDLAPVGCQIAQAQRPGEELKCTGHSCSEANCRAPIMTGLEPGELSLVLDEQGCPRCRNYVTDSMTEIFGRLLMGPDTACGWEQPLEAMMRALTTDHPENFNFRRPDAHLIIVFMTDEDDCTPTTPDLFNPAAEELGGYGPFRCWQWGLRCNESWELDPLQNLENYTGCRPLTESEGGKLRDVNRYVNELTGLVNSDDYRMFVQAVALTGPHQTDLTIVYEPTFSLWEPQPVSDPERRPVMSNLRLYDFAWRMSHLPDDMQWCFFNLLSEDWELPLGLLGQRLRDVMERSMEQK